MKRPRLQVKAIILDLDGTLVDSRRAYEDAARTAFSAFGLKRVSMKTFLEIPRRFEVGLLLDDLLHGIEVTRFRDIYLKAYYDATDTKSRPFPNVVETLEKLSKKMKLALTTRRHVLRTEIVRQLKKFGMAEYFPVVVTATDTVVPKPSPESLLLCSKKLGVEIQDCLVVGDSVVDVRAGRNAGAKTAAVLSGIFSRNELESEKPDLILENVTELPDFLE